LNGGGDTVRGGTVFWTGAVARMQISLLRKNVYSCDSQVFYYPTDAQLHCSKRMS